MILTGPEIVKEVEYQRIHIKPFEPERVGPNSYDLCLGDTLKTYAHYDEDAKLWVQPHLDPKEDMPVHSYHIQPAGHWLYPGVLYLANTVEEAGSDWYVPMLEGRSSLGRLGLKVHVTAGFGDLGFMRQWTLELEVTHPLKIYRGMRVCQVYFHTVQGEKKYYEGKYQQSKGAEASQSWRDFEG
jgi:dCTP deaminase